MHREIREEERKNEEEKEEEEPERMEKTAVLYCHSVRWYGSELEETKHTRSHARTLNANTWIFINGYKLFMYAYMFKR